MVGLVVANFRQIVDTVGTGSVLRRSDPARRRARDGHLLGGPTEDKRSVMGSGPRNATAPTGIVVAAQTSVVSRRC
jgi:hypothetical protein